MNKYLQSFAALALISCSFEVLAQSLVQEKINIESALSAQIQHDLGSVLPDKSFAVFTSVVLRTRQVRELVEGESIVLKKDGDVKEQLDLPGFESPAASEDQPTSRERQAYRMTEKSELEKVSVNLVLDNSLPADKVAMAKTIVNTRLAGSFGNKAITNFMQASLMDATPNLPIANSIDSSDKLAAYFGRQEWVYAALIFFSLLVSFFVLRWLLTRRGQPSLRAREELRSPILDLKANPTLPLQAPPSYALPWTEPRQLLSANMPLSPESSGQPAKSPDQSLALDLAIERFVEEIAREPLSARVFLTQLGPSGLAVLSQCFADSPLRSVMESIFSFGVDDTQGPTTAVSEGLQGLSADQKAQKLDTMTAELHQYRKLLSLKTTQKFGFLSQFTALEAWRLLEDESPSVIAASLKHLPKNILSEVIKLIPQQQKLTVTALLSDPLTAVDIDAVEMSMRIKAEKAAQNILGHRNRSDDLVDLMVELSDDPKELVQDLGRVNKALLDRYALHAFTFDDLLADLSHNPGSPALAASLDQISNESIAALAQGLPEAICKLLLASLSEARQRTIKSIVLAYSEMYELSEVDKAKAQLLGLFRKELAKAKRPKLQPGQAGALL